MPEKPWKNGAGVQKFQEFQFSCDTESVETLGDRDHLGVFRFGHALQYEWLFPISRQLQFLVPHALVHYSITRSRRFIMT